jgi:hypothetical protein
MEGISEGLMEGGAVTVGLAVGTTGSPPTQNVSNVPSCIGTKRMALDPRPENSLLHSVHTSEPLNLL